MPLCSAFVKFVLLLLLLLLLICGYPDLELELQVVLNHLLWVLRTKLYLVVEMSFWSHSCVLFAVYTPA